MLVTKTSVYSGIERTLDIPITDEQWFDWKTGKCIQHAAPNLTSAQREFLLTGMTSDEWDDLFAEKEGQRDEMFEREAGH